jgi:hypothetical protein
MGLQSNEFPVAEKLSGSIAYLGESLRVWLELNNKHLPKLVKKSDLLVIYRLLFASVAFLLRRVTPYLATDNRYFWPEIGCSVAGNRCSPFFIPYFSSTIP